MWGAVEAAAAFVPGGPWPRDADALGQEVLTMADAAFEDGREVGRGLTIEAVAAEVSG